MRFIKTFIYGIILLIILPKNFVIAQEKDSVTTNNSSQSQENTTFASSKEEILNLLGLSVSPQETEPPVKKATRGIPPNTTENSAKITKGVAGIRQKEATRDTFIKKDTKIAAVIYFELNSDLIKEDSYVILDEFAKAFQDPQLSQYKFCIEGHSDSSGDAIYNKQLSLLRAESVKKYFLYKFHFDRNRIEVQGYGEEKPIADNNTSEGREKNRRVEFRIMGKMDQK